jgi:hypothetical protein
VSNTRSPQLPPAEIDEELEARLRGEMPRKKVKQTMYFERLEMTGTTKALIGLVSFLLLSIWGWMAATVQTTSNGVESIKDQQGQLAIKQAEQSAAVVGRLSAVESEVQGLKARTEKLEQEIRK